MPLIPPARPTLGPLDSLADSHAVSRIWRDRLIGAAAGAAITVAAPWFVLITAAATTIILRA